MDGDAVDLLGELYLEHPRWRATRRWHFERGHMAIHATATIGPIPSRGTWFAQLGNTATEWSTEAAAALADVQRRMDDYYEQMRRSPLYDDPGSAWEEWQP
jgi:hypothetical protein